MIQTDSVEIRDYKEKIYCLICVANLLELTISNKINYLHCITLNRYLVVFFLDHKSPYQFAQNSCSFKCPAISRSVVSLVDDEKEISSDNWDPLQTEIQ